MSESTYVRRPEVFLSLLVHLPVEQGALEFGSMYWYRKDCRVKAV